MRGSLPPNMPVGCGCATKERACRVGRTSPPRQRSAVDGGHGRRRARAGDKAECQAGNRRGRGAAHYCLQPRRGRGGVRPRNVAGASDCSMTAACSTSLPAAASLTAASTPERKASSVLLLGLPPDENPRPAEDDDRPVPGFRVSGGAIISKLVTFSHDLPHPRVHHSPYRESYMFTAGSVNLLPCWLQHSKLPTCTQQAAPECAGSITHFTISLHH